MLITYLGNRVSPVMISVLAGSIESENMAQPRSNGVEDAAQSLKIRAGDEKAEQHQG